MRLLPGWHLPGTPVPAASRPPGHAAAPSALASNFAPACAAMPMLSRAWAPGSARLLPTLWYPGSRLQHAGGGHAGRSRGELPVHCAGHDGRWGLWQAVQPSACASCAPQSVLHALHRAVPSSAVIAPRPGVPTLSCHVCRLPCRAGAAGPVSGLPLRTGLQFGVLRARLWQLRGGYAGCRRRRCCPPPARVQSRRLLPHAWPFSSAKVPCCACTHQLAPPRLS